MHSFMDSNIKSGKKTHFVKMKKLEIKNLLFSYKKAGLLFDNVSSTYNCPDEGGLIVSLMGSSGSGKTTLLKLILGMLKPNSGSIDIYPENAVVSYVPQEDILFDHLSPKENAEYFKFATSHRKRFDQQRLNEVSQSLNMAEVLNSNKRIDQLSGGEKQRLALLRALSINPDVLLLDEPCTGLDSEVKQAFLFKLRELASRYNLFVIYITHHIDEAKLVSDQISYLVSNKNDEIVNRIHNSSVTEFLNNPPTVKAAQMVNFPSGVFLKADILNGEIILKNNGDKHILVKEKNVLIGEDKKSWNFNIIANNSVFVQILHPETDNFLMLQKNWEIEGKQVSIIFEGECMVYNKTGILEAKINL